ncbi:MULTISPECIES: TetR family transcriptional regulator [unclassified Frankia]|uniref:TetR family transcriptional regulator n=1 Tax=unclassified Frankia TaxID=2632575 RepID=UPI002AD3577C|nr:MULTISPECIES: TetR family transcriptional regulator [unclassified Frankia]
MADAADRAPRRRSGRTAAGRRQVRRALVGSAMELFLTNGYEATTVDQIAEAAGVGRRTFFRYFSAKEEAIFPDHDEWLDDMARLFTDASPTEPPLAIACAGAQLVLDRYVQDADISLKRFQLTRRVPSLRDREIASTDRYERVVARYLQNRFISEAPHRPPEGRHPDSGLADSGLADSGLRSVVAAAAVVAAHNYVLRSWLKSGGTDDVYERARHAFGFVQRAFVPPPVSHRDDRGSLVACFHADASFDEVVGQLGTVMRRISD